MKLKKTIIAAALAAAALAPGLALAADKGCVQSPTGDAFVKCAMAQMWGAADKAQVAAQGEAYDRYVAKLRRGNGARPAADVVTPAEVNALPLTPYFKRNLLACASSGATLNSFVQSNGCFAEIEQDILLIQLAGELRAGVVQAIKADAPRNFVWALDVDYRAFVQLLAAERPGLGGLVPAVNQAVLNSASRALLRLAKNPSLEPAALDKYVADLVQERARR